MKREKIENKYTISPRAWTTLIVLGLSVLITMYGETMLLPAIPDIINEFHISYNTSSWILTDLFDSWSSHDAYCRETF